MKKWIALILILLLTGCSRQPMPSISAAPSIDGIEEPSPAPEPQVFHYRVDIDTWSDSYDLEDGTTLAECHFRLPALTALREDETVVSAAETEAEERALDVVQTFNDEFDALISDAEFDELIEMAQEDYAWRQEAGSDWPVGYWMELESSAYQRGRLVSVFGVCYSYTGGAHGNTYGLGWNYDTKAGAFFSPEALAADSTEFQEAMVQELIRQAEETADENQMEPGELFWPDYAEIIENWSSYAVYFNEEGMTVYFSPYELACYAAGPQIFTVSYDWLMPHLSEHGLQVLGLNT